MQTLAARRRVPEPPPDRGELLTPTQVANHPKLFNGVKNRRWVLRYVEHDADGRSIKVRLGSRSICYYFEDVRAWIAHHKDD